MDQMIDLSKSRQITLLPATWRVPQHLELLVLYPASLPWRGLEIAERRIKPLVRVISPALYLIKH